MPFPSDRPVPTGDLAEVLADLWDRLEEAAARAKPAFHLPTLCTAGGSVAGGECVEEEAGAGVSGRVVVLRHADRASGTLGCHTDRRSPKALALAARPATAWVFYDRAAKLQVRAVGESEVVTAGPDWEAAWAATTPSARRCYLAPHPPGTATDAPAPNIPDAFRRRDPTGEESAPGRQHFALIRTRVALLDRLHLAHTGHTRCRFDVTRDGSPGTWVAV